MKVLVLGGGGREHALCWKIARSPQLTKLWCAPGNAGIAQDAELVALDANDPGAVVDLCRDAGVELLVVGPEAPLEAGVSDAVRAAGIAVFGPSQAAAMLETSKAFAKEVCEAAGVPTARAAVFEDKAQAAEFIRTSGAPIVVKADGLAAGKGVTVAETVDEAVRVLDGIFDGPGGGRVLIEEALSGEEASVFALTDGEHVLPMAGAQDHKRARDGDRGPNTGGMGAYSPAPVLTPAIEEEVMERIVRPTLAEMKRRGTPYAGILYAGIMLTADGPKLIEFNARFGDPECQCLLPRLRSDILPVLKACAEGTLEGHALDWSPETCLTVVMASRGYPGPYEKGTVLHNIDRAAAVEGVEVFHAGTRLNHTVWEAHGGRVLGISALGADVAEARSRAYDAATRIDWEEGFFRSDIGWRAIG